MKRYLRLAGFFALGVMIARGAPAQAALLIDGGPDFPPPGGVTFSATGDFGREDGLTFNFSDFDLLQTANLYWGIDNAGPPTGVSLDGSMQLDLKSEVAGRMGTSWEPGETIYHWFGRTSVNHYDDGELINSTVETRLRISISSGSGEWTPDDEGILRTITAEPDALWHVTEDFSATIWLEARVATMKKDEVSHFVPYKDFYDGLQTTEDDAFGSFAGGFYWQENAQAVVPEPSSLALLGIGSLALLAYGYRRRKFNRPV